MDTKENSRRQKLLEDKIHIKYLFVLILKVGDANGMSSENVITYI